MSDHRHEFEAATASVTDLIERLDPGAFVNGFVLAAEVLDSDNQRAIWMFCPEGQSPWQTLGYCTHAIQTEQAATNARYQGD